MSKFVTNVNVFALIACFCLMPTTVQAQETLKGFDGRWNAEIECPGGALRFQILIEENEGVRRGYLCNGPEVIALPKTEIKLAEDGLRGTFGIPHYDSKIEFKADTTSNPM